jgi:hypothetical protein
MERDDKERQQSSDDGAAPRVGAASDRLRPWRRIGTQLVPLIGDNGFCALFGRALRTMAARYEWLSVDATRKSIDGLLGAVARDLDSVQTAIDADWRGAHGPAPRAGYRLGGWTGRCTGA